jgi:hypothetical protein
VKKAELGKDLMLRHVADLDRFRRLGRETGAFEIESTANTLADRGEQPWDFVVEVSLAPEGRRLSLYVVSLPRVTFRSVLDLLEDRKRVPPGGILVLTCPYLPGRVMELCREQKVGYLDGVGNGFLVGPGLFLHIEGRPNRSSPAVPTSDPFAMKGSRIVRALLSQPQRRWQVQELASEAGVSLGLASKVKTTLLQEAYLDEHERRLALRDPARLLQDWSQAYQPHVVVSSLFTLHRPHEAERRLAQWCRENGMPYAVTQLSAAWRYSPMVRFDRSVIYIDCKIDDVQKWTDLMAHLEARSVESGANLFLWLVEDSAVFVGAQEREGVTLVSPLQLYLDLHSLSGRGAEAAQEILERELPELKASGSLTSSRVRRIAP